MMSNAHMGMGIGFLFTKLFCLLFIIGVILFLVWAVRTLNKKQLKKLVTWLLVIGLLGMVGSHLLIGKKGNFHKGGEWKTKFYDKVQEEVKTP